MAKIQTESNGGGLLKKGIISVNSRNFNVRNILANQFDNSTDEKPSYFPIANPEHYPPYLSIGLMNIIDYVVCTSASPDHIVMIESSNVDRGTSVFIYAKESFSLMIQAPGIINGGTNANDSVVIVPVGSRIEIFKMTSKNWTAELVDINGVRTAPVAVAYTPT